MSEAKIGGIEELLKSVELQSLEHLSAVRVATVVCESEDVQHMIGRFSKTIAKQSSGFLDGQWKRLCGQVRRKLDQVGVPEIIVDIILEKLWPISFEVCKWILYHGEDIGIYASSEFFWTPLFNIDYEKTAKMLTENDAVDIKKRFKLACFYCLKREVRSLWEMMSLPEKRSFFIRGNLKKSDLNPIVLYWTYYMQELPIEYWECKKLTHSQLFKHAVENGNLSATKFFLSKFEKPLRNLMISNSFRIYLCKLYKCDCVVKGSQLAIGYFLISVMTDCRLIRPYNAINLIFCYFLEWPFQKHLMTVVDRLLPFRENIFGDLMVAIFEKDLGSFKDYDYKTLFKEVWLQSLTKYKTYVNTDSTIGSTMFVKFVKKHFGFVFDENSYSLKAKFRAIVFHRDTSEEIAYCEKEDVEFFKFLVQERVATKSSINSLVLQRSIYLPYQEYNPETSYYNLPLGELMYLIDGILGII